MDQQNAADAIKALDLTPYTASFTELGDGTLAMARNTTEKFLVHVVPTASATDRDLCGESKDAKGLAAKICPLTHENSLVLRSKVKWTEPISLRDRTTTLGCGDRLGLASAGHIHAARKYQVAPVLAQQSIRELTLTNRTYKDVVDCASFLVFQEGWKEGYGADGDHLKTMDDINVAVDAGMAMITLDQTEVMHAEPENYSAEKVDEEFAKLPDAVREHVLQSYADRTFKVADEEVTISATEAKRCALMYLDACDFTKEVYEHLKSRRGDQFDLELSIDETTAPTLPSHHLFIINELCIREVEVTSLAPRFIGDFQKGIDYIGDLNEFETQFKVHCAIAKEFGNYKISVHSGSDKFSVNPIIGKYTDMRLHLKTAGTSWLEALRVIAHEDPTLFREIFKAAEAGYAEALKLYHITADFAKVPKIDDQADTELGDYLEQDESRQLLHISYGVLLQNPVVAPKFFAAMHRYEDTYYRFLDRHFTRHLDTLGVPTVG